MKNKKTLNLIIIEMSIIITIIKRSSNNSSLIFRWEETLWT